MVRQKQEGSELANTSVLSKQHILYTYRHQLHTSRIRLAGLRLQHLAIRYIRAQPVREDRMLYTPPCRIISVTRVDRPTVYPFQAAADSVAYDRNVTVRYGHVDAGVASFRFRSVTAVSCNESTKPDAKSRRALRSTSSTIESEYGEHLRAKTAPLAATVPQQRLPDVCGGRTRSREDSDPPVQWRI